MENLTNERKEEFLTALTELSKEYDIVITGCGCCSSPNLISLDEEHKNGMYLLPGEFLVQDFLWVCDKDKEVPELLNILRTKHDKI